MNGRLRSIPSTTTNCKAAAVSILPISPTHKHKQICICNINRQDVKSATNSCSRGDNDTTTTNVCFHNSNANGNATHQALNAGSIVPIGNTGLNDLTSATNSCSRGDNDTTGNTGLNDTTVDVDHCWYNITTSDDNNVISILAKLSRCRNNAPSTDYASSSSSIVRLYFYSRNNSDTPYESNGVLVATIQTFYHAVSIEIGGDGSSQNALLVIARSSGIELHSLQSVVDKFLERDSGASEEREDILEPQQATRLPASTPMRRSKYKPMTPLAPKSLSLAFENNISTQIQQQHGGRDFASPARVVSSTSTTTKSHVSTKKKTSTMHQPLKISAKPIELLPSFCIHAMNLSYPYLSVASGDRIGVWNIRHINSIQNATWAITLPPTKSAHRRVTSLYMTQCKKFVAVSCWDGSAFVYVANDSACHTKGDGLFTSWSLVGSEQNIIDPSTSRSSSRIKPSWEQPTQSNDGLFPTFIVLRYSKFFSNMFTMFDEEGGGGRRGGEEEANHHTCIPGSLIMAVSTPGSATIRCFDVYSQLQLARSNDNEAGEIHGIVTSASNGPDYSDTDDMLVWVTEDDEIHSQPWDELLVGSAINATVVKWMKQSAAKCNIATSTNNEKSKVCLFWSKTSSSWTLQCQWECLDKQQEEMQAIIPAPFLSESDVIDLVQANLNGYDQPDSFSTKTQTLITQEIFAVIIPTYQMMYVCARNDMIWRTIDLENDVSECHVSVSAKVVVLDSCSFVLVMYERAEGSIIVKTWKSTGLTLVGDTSCPDHDADNDMRHITN